MLYLTKMHLGKFQMFRPLVLAVYDKKKLSNKNVRSRQLQEQRRAKAQGQIDYRRTIKLIIIQNHSYHTDEQPSQNVFHINNNQLIHHSPS